MRRLPIYFLVDVSESMVGEPIEQVQNGMRTIIQELRVDPYALETAFVSIIAFAGKAQSLSPLTELYKFYPPTFPIGGGTSLGVAMNYLMDDIDKSIQKTTLEARVIGSQLFFCLQMVIQQILIRQPLINGMQNTVKVAILSPYLSEIMLIHKY